MFFDGQKMFVSTLALMSSLLRLTNEPPFNHGRKPSTHPSSRASSIAVTSDDLFP